LLLSGCQDARGTSPETDAPESTTASSSTRTATAAPVDQYDTTLDEVTPYLVSRAISKYGYDKVRAGTDLAMAFERGYAFNEDLVTAVAPEGMAHMLAAGEQMTPSTRTEWQRKVRRYVDVEDRSKYPDLANYVYSVAIYDALDANSNEKDHAQELHLPADGPVIVNPRFKSVRTDIVENYLWVKITSVADFRVQQRLKPARVAFRRTMRFWLVRHNGSWKISSWRGEAKIGKLRADK
jgi:hypothetical protein